MKSFPLGALSLALAMVPSTGITAESQAPSEARSETAEAVHVQPRERTLAPGSAEDDNIQRKLDSVNKAEQDLGKMLDKKLIICRRC